MSALRANGWIDVHAHFHTPKTREELEMTAAAMSHFGCFLLPEPFEWTPELALDHMDRWGIAMQLLSNIPKTAELVRISNEYGAELVRRYPSRFGLLAALPTNDPDAALREIARADAGLHADGFAVTCCYGEVYLGDKRLWPVWAELNRRKASVFMHPDAVSPPSLGRPAALLEVAFETTRTVVDMLYAGLFREFPDIRFVVAHCGAALPALSGRLALLGAEAWVPNPLGITSAEITQTVANLFFDTAATGSATHLRPAITAAGKSHLVYGSDCGVPCSTEATLSRNLLALLQSDDLSAEELQTLGRNAANLFPSVLARLEASLSSQGHDHAHAHIGAHA